MRNSFFAKTTIVSTQETSPIASNKKPLTPSSHEKVEEPLVDEHKKLDISNLELEVNVLRLKALQMFPDKKDKIRSFFSVALLECLKKDMEKKGYIYFANYRLTKPRDLKAWLDFNPPREKMPYFR